MVSGTHLRTERSGGSRKKGPKDKDKDPTQVGGWRGGEVAATPRPSRNPEKTPRRTWHILRSLERAMSNPRYITPGATVMVTRRTLRRHHLFRPDAMIQRIFLYFLAVCAERFGILVHAAVLMSTHEHLIITDVQGNLPRFLERFHRPVALATKVLRGWEGPIWDTGKTSIVRLESEQAIIEKIAYVLANPVAAGLVHRSEEWPGVTQRLSELGQSKLIATRPDEYVDPDNPLWPKQTELSLSLPPTLAGKDSREGIVRRIGAELRLLEEGARAEVRKTRWRVPGARRVRLMSPTKRARSFEKLRSLNPTFATGRGRRDLYVRVARQLRAFRESYREAFTAWREGARDAPFPHGTWEMVQVHGARGTPCGSSVAV